MAAPCKFGRACHRPGCYFAHPEGRDCDDGAGAAQPGGARPAAGARRSVRVAYRGVAHHTTPRRCTEQRFARGVAARGAACPAWQRPPAQR